MGRKRDDDLEAHHAFGAWLDLARERGLGRTDDDGHFLPEEEDFLAATRADPDLLRYVANHHLGVEQAIIHLYSHARTQAMIRAAVAAGMPRECSPFYPRHPAYTLPKPPPGR